MTNATIGDTINVGAGSASWGADGLQVTKSGLKIIGAGVGLSIVTGAGAACIDDADDVRLSGFTFNSGTSASACGIAVLSVQASHGVRIDHITINHPNWSTPTGCFWVIGALDGSKNSNGLLDHSTLVNCRVLVWGEWTDTGGRFAWSRGAILGTSDAWFVEDNDYTIVAGSPGPGLTCDNAGRVLCNFVDTNTGGAIVSRFNTIHNSYSEIHPTFAWNDRGGKLNEYYYNTTDLGASFQGGFSRPFFFQGGGGGVAFNNTFTGTWSEPDFSYDYQGRPAACNGSNVSDGNKVVGWPCLDALGVGYETTVMTNTTNVGQTMRPWYTWQNTINSNQITWVANDVGLGNIYKNNRDFYQYTASFNGTSGMGVGTIANRPSTCNPDPTGDYTTGGLPPRGVGYWATDEGEWNSNQAGADGRLYVCTATNTWALFYTPYTYPHPLQGVAVALSVGISGGVRGSGGVRLQ